MSWSSRTYNRRPAARATKTIIWFRIVLCVGSEVTVNPLVSLIHKIKEVYFGKENTSTVVRQVEHGSSSTAKPCSAGAS